MTHADDSLAGLLEAALPVSLRHIPQHLSRISRSLDARAALVGGLPRDLLRIQLKQVDRELFASTVRDFDVCVEGDAVAFAFEAQRRLPGKLTVNPAFKTATLITGDPVSIDFTTARRESYRAPGMLPDIDTSGICLEEDMLRRDFTLGAVAIGLGAQLGALIDVAGGAGDIRDRRIRSLHERSFIDDPTRMFRAMRYAMRLEYKLEESTQIQMMTAIHEAVVDFLSPERLRYEIECIGREEYWGDVWQAIDYLGLSASMHSALDGLNKGWLASDARALDIAIRHHVDFLLHEDVPAWLVRSAWALGLVPSEKLEAVCQRCGFFKRHAHWMLLARAVMRAVAETPIASIPPSMACSLLETFPRQAVILAAFTMQPHSEDEVRLRSAMMRFLTEWSQVRSGVDAAALMLLGVPRGPLIGELRGRLRYLRIDGLVQDDAQELSAARRIVGDMLERGSTTPEDN